MTDVLWLGLYTTVAAFAVCCIGAFWQECCAPYWRRRRKRASYYSNRQEPTLAQWVAMQKAKRGPL